MRFFSIAWLLLTPALAAAEELEIYRIIITHEFKGFEEGDEATTDKVARLAELMPILRQELGAKDCIIAKRFPDSGALYVAAPSLGEHEEIQIGVNLYALGFTYEISGSDTLINYHTGALRKEIRAVLRAIPANYRFHTERLESGGELIFQSSSLSHLKEKGAYCVTFEFTPMIFYDTKDLPK